MNQTDKRTIRKILKSLEISGIALTQIEGYRYKVMLDDYHPDEILYAPLGTGSVASSAVGFDAYEYTHGGNTFREAVDNAKAVRDALREKRAGQEQEPSFLKDLAWNGQIVRFFDANGTEYDLAPSNAAVGRGEKIYQVSWTSPDGYEITHVFNE